MENNNKIIRFLRRNCIGNIFILTTIAFVIGTPWQILSAKTRVVCSTTDIAWFVEKIGAEQVKVDVIAQPKRDAHFVDVRPSFMIKVAKADIVFKVGLDLDLWMDQIINGSRNNNLPVMDCSEKVKPLEIPQYEADARYGDIHQRGNPHYWLTPLNITPITEVILAGLNQVIPKHAEEFSERRDSLLNAIEQGILTLSPKIDSLRNVEVIYYHNSWPYFNEFTGLITAGFIEPFPGVPPSPSHLKKLTEEAQAKSIKVIAVENYFDKRSAQKVASTSGAKVVILYPSIGGRNKNETYMQWITSNIDAVLEAIR